MLKLNIIPQELKNEKRLASIYKSLKILFGVSIMIFAVYGIIFLSAKFVLQLRFIEVMNETAITAKNRENYDEKIKNIKSKISFIDKIQKDTVLWSYLIEYIADNSGNGIKYAKLSINKDKEELNLSGRAENRDDLIKLKETLENAGYFSSVNLPLKNLLEKTNINFDISLKIKNYEFVRI
ncbi:hypothetical protein A2303_05960 [Candidatus Falkowbacteria bacterium RIFOXYB2_FULL_47_14]|uniref:PilN domain-containing protein n=1 Tax=Candidatus Falkowbacteria bacterium RIFOXYA2_FULL_47_19 TaxID=1797994 RepID=A0A1F5SMX5_9BACT|nr:MAG: hypothetical protein A2227_04700 [Candidatus Falkowbacteria bacterium RIFOXYA2_FULL_47_19]OGF35988.1 MAG: hypothetical protein A2468_00395 [Candidatus Falkowbacteria bacterium RIFOXYC2_FULL_46_15]OGF42763.1 MAG: hypothetical protein A2303_05960 [Candidatus Falkowbacteria bacterium RIFOXYB2_FULL_47_14]